MDTPTLLIGGTPIPLAAAWIHLKAHPHDPVSYEVSVPRSHWQVVFDPGARRLESQSWKEFIEADLMVFGTFIVDGWFEAMSELARSESLPWKWVIATIDGVSEDGDKIRIVGRAEQFEPRRFA
jgi:hypothetical protein